MLNVLAVPRDDYFQVPGGDKVHLEYMRAHTRRYGVNIEVVTATYLPSSAAGVDAVYITQTFQPGPLAMAINWARQHSLPVYVNALAEENLPLWFEQARQVDSKWRSLAAALGRNRAEKAFVRWRRMRRKTDPHWRLIRDALQCAHLVPNSRYELNHLIDWFDLDSPQATIVPLGVDIRLSEDGANESATGIEFDIGDYILEVGMISQRKNQLGLLRACFDRPEAIVLLGRESPYEPDYCTKVRELATKRERVFFLDYVTTEQLADLYAQAKVHVLPSWSERPGMVTVEAAACGCPVVSTCISSIKDYLGNDVWLCDPRSETSINEAIERAIAEPPPPDLQRKTRDRYTWENAGEKLATMFRSTLSRGLADEA